MSAERFRKKPVEVEALRFTGENFPEVVEFLRPHPFKADLIGTPSCGITLSTLEGEHRITNGWWIVRGVKGEFYGVRADIFDATYEPSRMTPTPQERTELQRLAELCSPEEWYDPDDLVSALADKFGSSKGTAADAAFIAACSPTAILALISLAAESEELRAENERWREHHESDERLRLKYLAERDTALAALEKERAEKEEEHKRFENAMRLGDEQVALTIKFRGERNDERESRRTLESRYTALEKALRDAVEAADAGSGTVSLKELRRILALTPKEGE